MRFSVILAGAAAVILIVIGTLVAAQAPTLLPYPETRKIDQVDDYFGTKVADPYRWLEDPNSPETVAWVEAQNKVTFTFLEGIPTRERLRTRLTDLWNYERYGLPERHGRHYIYARNDGLQNQPVVYRAASLDAAPEVLIDPNELSPDGTIALTGRAFTDDGRYMAYALSTSGSDWMEWRIREVATGKDLPDLVRWSKFSGAAWLKDGSGFFYSRYDEPEEGEAYTGVNKNQRVYFHAIGTSQQEDRLVYARPDQPDWGFSTRVTDDGRFLVISQWEGTEPKNRLFVQDLEKEGSEITAFLDGFDAEYTVVGNDGDRFYIHTDNDAPRYRLVAIDRGRPDASEWKTLIAEAPDRAVLSDVTLVGDEFLVVWRTHAHDRLQVYALDGRKLRDVELPAIGTVSVRAQRRDTEAFYAFTSFTYPTTIYRYDLSTAASSVFRKPKVDFRAEDYETVQVFYPAKDGTKIPMFLTHRKDLERNGRNPTYLYGYGGFGIALTPSFTPANVAWLEMGGIFAVANLRGGGEYGREWHDAGRLANKENVFDDFIAAAEYLIAEKYTSTPRLAIAGGSNGGLLVGAAITRRPDLFGAAVPAVGVMDMLRFHQFTIGWAWTSDYGSAETKEGFETLIRYSPLHNIRPGVTYPATLVTTADHDDRVVPAHSHKFTATLQAAQAGPAPILTRIETRAGHGAGRATRQVIDERADVFAFLTHVLGMDGNARATP